MPTPISNTSSVTSPSLLTPTTSNPDFAPATPAGYSSVDTFEVANAVNETLAAQDNGRTALQKHVDFFDRNNNGSITLSETHEGLVALGLGSTRSWGLATAINAGLGITTGASWFSPLTINTANIAAGKHPSDSDIYDEQGNFSAPKFAELFDKFDLDGDGALSNEEFVNFRNRKFEDESSSLASSLEFGLLMEIAGEDRGDTRVLTAATLASFYDGSLFYRIAGEPVPF